MVRAVLTQFIALLLLLIAAGLWDDMNRPDPGPMDAEIDALFLEFGLQPHQ